jgi:glycosyltransferase involved in cell wall biosynthesis
MDNSKINFSAVVVTLNDVKYLRQCLSSLSFCNQLIVMDLGSSYETLKIANQYGAEIYDFPRTPISEPAKKKGVEYTKNDWILIVDPDEVLPKNIEIVFRSEIEDSPDLGVVYLPWQFYFKGQRLTYTIWGSGTNKAFLFHKHRNRFNSDSHYGFTLLDDYRRIRLPQLAENTVQHYWCDSYGELIKKHVRYIKADGQSRYNQGQRFAWSHWIRETLYALKVNIFDYKGLNNGLRGFLLTMIYAGYTSLGYLSLYLYQKGLK